MLKRLKELEPSRVIRTLLLTLVAVLIVDGVLAVGVHVLRAQVANPNTNQAQPNGQLPEDRGKPWSAFGSKTDTSNLQIQAAPGALQSVYIYEAFCTNVHASTASVALIKYSTTTVASVSCTPGVTGHNAPTFFDPPLKIPANTAVTMNSPASVTTLYFYAAGTVAR